MTSSPALSDQIRSDLVLGVISHRSLLLGMLKARMVEIVDQWTSGKLTQAGFSASEVCGVIRAVFTDSSRRAEALSTIQAHSRAAGTGDAKQALSKLIG